ncbi:MAG: transcriptional regulator [Defluviitaleaceae bacterium]|nr:transcriptional regulator [Defluviitaleaceae bacterium]
MKEEVLQIMRELGKPVTVAEVVKKSGQERFVIDRAFKELKAEQLIVSPIRCKWEPAK